MYIFQSEVMRASFHFPLHRYLAAFICQAVRHMDVSITDLLPHTDMLMLLMMHPLRVQVRILTITVLSHAMP